ncbi:MAG: hypothetical protein NWE89_13565, partial [Candidatus Bathyarchaeota archaeon]|nr:hypothetical protein [Candidatus Bathyarchaeota archaeon]
MSNLRDALRIKADRVEEINHYLLKPGNPLVDGLLNLVEKHGGVNQINRKAEKKGNIKSLMTRLKEKKSPYHQDLEWLTEKRDQGAFITVPEYRQKILGEKAESTKFDDSHPVTLEISACNFFPFLIEEAKKAIEERSLMPARYIRVRGMMEQVEDDDILAFAAAMKILGASYVQTLDTKGTAPGPDGLPVNLHLGGPDTITGYFGGIGAPNEYALKWVDEYLHYYTMYGVNEVLNINPGTVILGYMLYKLGIDITFKISVFMGNDNPYSCLWTLMTAKLFSRDDGSTPLIGFNLSNAVDNTTIIHTAKTRDELGFMDHVRLEHHIVETWKSIVRQPYDRLDELLELA